jgi:hypothetical protein
MSKQEPGGHAAGLAIVLAGGTFLAIAGGLAYVLSVRQHENALVREKVQVEEQRHAEEAELRNREVVAKREATRAARDAALREAQIRKQAEADDEAKALAEAHAAHEAEQIEALHAAELRAEKLAKAAKGLEAAPGVKVGVKVRVTLAGEKRSSTWIVAEIRGTRARVAAFGSEEATTWIDFQHVSRFEVIH